MSSSRLGRFVEKSAKIGKKKQLKLAKRVTCSVVSLRIANFVPAISWVKLVKARYVIGLKTAKSLKFGAFSLEIRAIFR